MQVFSLIRCKENSAPRIIGIYDSPDTACDAFVKRVKKGDVLSDGEDAERAIDMMRSNNYYVAENGWYYHIYHHYVHTKTTKEYFVNIDYKMSRTMSIIADSEEDATQKAKERFESGTDDVTKDEIGDITNVTILNQKEV